MSDDDINHYIPSILNPRCVKKQSGNLNLTQHSVVSRYSLSLKKSSAISKWAKNLNKMLGDRPAQFQSATLPRNHLPFQEENNSKNKHNTHENDQCLLNSMGSDIVETVSFSAIDDFNSIKNDNKSHKQEVLFKNVDNIECYTLDTKSNDTILYDIIEKPVFSLSFCISNCKNVDVRAKNTNIMNFSVSHDNNNTNIECNVIEGSYISSESEIENMNENILPSPPKKQAIAVNLEIKKKKDVSKDNNTEESNVLILNTNAIEKLSHVIVQPPNYKLVKRKIPFRNKLKFGASSNVPVCDNKLKQKLIDDYLCKDPENNSFGETVIKYNLHDAKTLMLDDVEAMNKNSSVADTVNCDKIKGTTYKTLRNNDTQSRKSKFFSPKTDITSIRQQNLKASCSEVPRNASPTIRNDSLSSYLPGKNVDSLHFSLPSKSIFNKAQVVPKNIPFYKIIAGTHIAVDAFSYGDIPNVNNYFLTHFHSDHYSGLKKSFNKLLFCTKITADLCTSRLGVNPKYIHLINLDETITVDGVEVTAIDANHCPGAVMLVFTLPNGKTFLHTGDFRASPIMESYPIFWNKDIHTIYLDTTYCNPRYDFPTQDQSFELALHLLREKKTSLEEAGKKFSSVLIVCGTYTIGKEKFFLGIARRVGCAVWACPEKDRVLQIVEGRSFNQASPQSCQLHVVPMRDLTHEKLRAYLDGLKGAFSEVVAFKPSGWENGKNSTVQKDFVTIHGIPYSEHSSFSEMIRFVKFLKPKQVIPTVDISGGAKAVQQYFPCPLVYKEDFKCQSRLTDYFNVKNRQQVPGIT
ncbi:unnamed protein product [Parnassius mnemosyne]|uniref:DNA repair metallo-beta-lactamase domain-containing protein n=1 Tax=Parnassius mnemosyne TaxID=213953 RepID=A0AAV1L5M8_9NEOP